MKILGLSFDYHDSAAALIVDGRVVAACQEERFSRNKHDASFPHRSIAACLEFAGLDRKALDLVAFYEQPLQKFDRIIYGFQQGSARQGARRFRDTVSDSFKSWIRQGKFDVRRRIAEGVGIGEDRIRLFGHHQSHAASAFFCSPFNEATVITLDGVGEYETASVSLGRGLSLQPISSVRYPDSIGLFYSAMTAFLGFEVNEGEYKVMGMAGFGEAAYLDRIQRLIAFSGDGFRLDQRYFSFLMPDDLPFTPELVALLGPPRQPEAPFFVGDRARPPANATEAESRHYADIAASVQRVTEELILSFVEAAVARTGVRRVAMAGGVALNSLANGRLQRELGIDLYVQPAAGDSGGALGAALQAFAEATGSRPEPLRSAYLGSRYSREEAQAALTSAGVDTFTCFTNTDELLEEAARLLAGGAVIGWMQDRFEWGPRALGARSILASPLLPDMQRTINEKIKFREPFRPFAPAVVAERAEEFFDLTPEAGGGQLRPETFMLSVCSVRPEARPRIPAVTHVDGTARVQLVHADSESRFRKLLEKFGKRTGVPVLLNTSFNRRGEPIVASPADAIRTFSWSGLDYLIMDDILVRKEFF